MPTYNEYVAAGGGLTNAEYTRLARGAWAYLSSVTLGKAAAAEGNLRSIVVSCFYDIVAELCKQEKGEVVSATNDGYSESYAQSGKTNEAKLYSIAMRYLISTGLMERRLGRVRLH